MEVQLEPKGAKFELGVFIGGAERVILELKIINCGRPRPLVGTILHNTCGEKGPPSIFKLERSQRNDGLTFDITPCAETSPSPRPDDNAT